MVRHHYSFYCEVYTWHRNFLRIKMHINDHQNHTYSSIQGFNWLFLENTWSLKGIPQWKAFMAWFEEWYKNELCDHINGWFSQFQGWSSPEGLEHHLRVNPAFLSLHYSITLTSHSLSTLFNYVCMCVSRAHCCVYFHGLEGHVMHYKSELQKYRSRG